MMGLKNLFVALIASASVIVFQANATSPQAQVQSAILTGQVSSEEEGLMEGVLVTAKRVGSTITTTVVSDPKGIYSFPASRLEAGHYEIRIRAIGYDLGSANTVDVQLNKTAKLDLKLLKTTDLASQLSNSEWVNSATGTDQQKGYLLRCVNCHTLERIFRSKHTLEEFEKVVARMGNYANNSMSNDRVLHAQVRPGKFAMTDVTLNASNYKRIAEYLSSINLNGRSTWNFPLKTSARPTGRSTLQFTASTSQPGNMRPSIPIRGSRRA